MSGQEQKNKKKKATLSPLHYAARHGHLDKVEYLVDAVGVDIDAKSNIKCKHTAKVSLRPTALALACWHGHLDVVKFLAQAGASTADESAVYWAIANNQLHVADYLLACGGDHVEYGALVRAACIAGEMKTLEYVWPLAEDDPQLFTTRNWQEAATVVSRNGSVEMLQWLHEKSLLKDHPLTHPDIFHSAVLHHHTNCADYLLENKLAVPDVATARQMLTALHKASSAGNLAAVEFLLSRGANHKVQDIGGEIPLEKAIGNGRMLVAWHLIRKCLTASSPVSLIQRASTCASDFQRVDIVMYLFERFHVRPTRGAQPLGVQRTRLLRARRVFVTSNRPRVIPAIERSFYHHRLFDANLVRVVFEFVGGGFVPLSW